MVSLPKNPDRPWRVHLAALGGYLALALVFTLPLAANFATAIPGDGFDGLQNYWNLWWVRRALLELQTTPFFTHELFYPQGASLYFHTLNVLNGLWTLPLQLLTNLAVSYNSVVVLTFVLSGYGAFLLAHYAVRRVAAPARYLNAAAFAAGFVFAFAPVRFAHLLGHMQVLSTEWIPFFVLAFIQMDGRRGSLLRRAWLPALFLALNALCDWYFVLYLLLFCALVVGYRWVALFVSGSRRLEVAPGGLAAGRPPTWTEAFPRAGDLREIAPPPKAPLLSRRRILLSPLYNCAAVVGWFTLLLSPLLVPMLSEAASAAYLRPPFEETVLLSADLLAFITPSEFHPWWGETGRAIADNFTSSTSERTLFAGYAAIALAALGVWRYRRAAALWLSMLGAFFVLALGPYLHVLGTVVSPLPLPYAWLYALMPLVRITRSVSRYDIMVMLALGVLAAFGLLALRARPRLAGLCALLVAVEFLAVPYPLSQLQVPAFYEQLGRETGEFAILELPINWDRPDPLLYQTVHGHPLISAYTSRTNPLSVVEQTPVLNLLRTLEPDIIQYDVRTVGASVLSDLDVRYVINHPLTMGEGDERRVTNDVLRQIFGSQPPVVNEPNLVVYRVTPPATRVPYVTLGAGWGAATMVGGKPARVISSEATFELHHGETPIRLRLTARAVDAAATVKLLRIELDRRTALGSFELGASATTADIMLPASGNYQIVSTTPVEVAGLAVEAR